MVLHILRISCGIIGKYREKSKVLVSAFTTKVNYTDEKTTPSQEEPPESSNVKATSSQRINAVPSDAGEALYEGVPATSAQSGQTLSDVVTEQVLGKMQTDEEENSLALVPYSHNLNRNTNAKIEGKWFR